MQSKKTVFILVILQWRNFYASIGKKTLPWIKFPPGFNPFQASPASIPVFLCLDWFITTISSTLESYKYNQETIIQLKWLELEIRKDLYQYYIKHSIPSNTVLAASQPYQALYTLLALYIILPMKRKKKGVGRNIPLCRVLKLQDSPPI